MSPKPPVDPDEIEVCTGCDLAQRRPALRVGELARCGRCHRVLSMRKVDSVDQALAISVGGLILSVAASLLPVLGMEGAGFSMNVSPVDTVGALATSGFWPLSALALGLVVIAPIARYAAMVVVLLELRRGARPRPWMGRVFRVAMLLRPWAMSEVFLVGVVVSLIKLGDLVTIEIGLAFWALVALLLVLVLEHRVVSVNGIWERLEPVK